MDTKDIPTGVAVQINDKGRITYCEVCREHAKALVELKGSIELHRTEISGELKALKVTVKAHVDEQMRLNVTNSKLFEVLSTRTNKLVIKNATIMGGAVVVLILFQVFSKPILKAFGLL